jgi:hypothetical protein
MKHSSSQQTKGIPQFNNKQRPENKDNLDSRKNEEQDFKGDDTTHNKKDHHNQPKGKNQK